MPFFNLLSFYFQLWFGPNNKSNNYLSPHWPALHVLVDLRLPTEFRTALLQYGVPEKGNKVSLHVESHSTNLLTRLFRNFRTLMYNIPVITVLFSLSWLVGMVIYATYADCDPLSKGYTKKYDEILPFFVEDRFNYLPGILGLFMASLFNGALR